MTRVPRAPDVRLAAWIASQADAYTSQELRAAWTEWQLRAAVARGDVVRVLPGVYAAARHSDDPVVRARAIAAWCPRALVTGSLALYLYDARLPPPATADAIVAVGVRVRAPTWLNVRQVPTPRVTGRPERVPCVVPERAVLDAWHTADPSERVNVIYEALWRRVTNASAVMRELGRLPRVSGRRVLVRILEDFLEGSHSPLEVIARRSVFRGAEWSAFESQVELTIAGRPRRADMLHRAARVALEFDGDRYHSGTAAAEADRQRDLEFASEGYTTLHFKYRDLVGRPEWCRSVVRAAVRSRLKAPRP